MTLSILSALIGFMGPFLPEVLKWLNRRQELAHEIQMTAMRIQAAAQEHLWRMEEINTQADIAEAREIHKPMASWGVQILDKAQGSTPAWCWVPVFWAFAVVDWLAAMVRPGVTAVVVGFWGAYKVAYYSTLTGPRFENAWDSAVLQMWTEDDMSLLLFVLTYWFGQRAAKAAFGGNASNASAGK